MTDDFIIRPYDSGDRAGVLHLWKTTFPDADDAFWNHSEHVIDTKLRVQPGLFLVAEIERDVCGTVLAGFDGVRGWVHRLAVDPEHHRKGIATALMRRAGSELARIGCPKLNLQVRASNAGVVAFYESLGYGVEDRLSLGKPLSA